MSNIDGSEFTLENAQKIYGYFDKSFLIELMEYLFKGDEKNVIKNFAKQVNSNQLPHNMLYYLC